jgi:hypothetical protein
VHYRYVQGQTVGEGFETIGNLVGSLVTRGHEALGSGSDALGVGSDARDVGSDARDIGFGALAIDALDLDARKEN